MPFIKIITSCPISKEQESKLGKTIELVPGKCEVFLLLCFEDKCHLWLRGENSEPMAYIEASVFGNESYAGYPAFSAEVTSTLQNVLGIVPEDCYIKYEDITAGAVAVSTSTAKCFGDAMKDKLILTVFTDPMMGLSYESEPIMDRLATRYARQIEFRYVMALLVRDVSDFMLPEERDMDPESGIRCYCRRLALIYKNEESIGGLPINMDGFCLFDSEHRSSRPLNLAYKAAQLTEPAKADVFLTELRHATVLGCRPTTHFDEILRVVCKVGIPEDTFVQHYQDGSAEAALEEDLAFTRSLGIRSLPAYLTQYGDDALLMQSFDYHVFEDNITRLLDHS